MLLETLILILYSHLQFDQLLHNINTLITYDLLLHVSTLIRHLQGALRAWLKLHTLLL